MVRSGLEQTCRIRAGRRSRCARGQCRRRRQGRRGRPRAGVADRGLARRAARAGIGPRPGRYQGARGRDRPRDRARRERRAGDVRCRMVRALHRQRHAAQTARADRVARLGADRARRHRTKYPPARCARRASAHGALVARAAGRVRGLQTGPRPGRHVRPRSLRSGAAARRHARGLGAGAPGRAHPPCADRRVPGHQPLAMARTARMVVGLRRRRWRSQRPACAGGVHRRRSETKHLPLPARRAARVRRGAGVCGRGAGWGHAGLRSHAAQCPRTAAGIERGVRASGAGR